MHKTSVQEPNKSFTPKNLHQFMVVQFTTAAPALYIVGQ